MADWTVFETVGVVALALMTALSLMGVWLNRKS
mgnify:CR=1 FL=1